MSEDIKKSVGHLSPKVVIPVFIIIVLGLFLGLFYALNPDNFISLADSASDTVAAKFKTNVIIEETSSFGGQAVPEEPRADNFEMSLPQIGRAVVMIYPVSTDKTKDNPGAPPVYVGKAIELDLSVQRMFIWQDGRLLNNWLISTGREDKPTKQGNFKILDKIPMAYGSGGGDNWTMPNWMGFYWAGGTENGFHGLPWINGRKEGPGSLGRPVSHGCVRSGDANQEWLYNWAEIGMPVIVHK